jgi:hypothetical protein
LALPGLGYGTGFVVGQTAFAISNAVPAGGAVGLGVQYGMLGSYGFGAAAATSAIAMRSSSWPCAGWRPGPERSG